MQLKSEIMQLFTTYLCGIGQQVKVADVLSEERVLEYVVPQGSELGPLLFNKHQSGIFSLNFQCNIIGFADDTAILVMDDGFI